MKTLTVIALALLLALAPAAADEPADTEKAKAVPEKKVWTTDDLEKRYGPPSRDAGTEAEREREAFGEQALERMMEGPDATAADREARARRAVSRAEARLDYLQKKLASIRNPLLARPSPDEDDAREEAGMDNAAREARTRDQIARAEADLRRARAALAALVGAARPEPAPARQPETRGPARKEPERRTVTGDG